MHANNFANEYESLLDYDPNFFDEYIDPDQRIDTFIYDLTFYPVERYFEIEPSVLSH